ncbi:MAG: tyrosine-type recombinase/integrase [Jatrophihabitantaceae bacterium]
MKVLQRRQYGTGSIFWNAALGLWIGTIEAGTSARGTRRRITVSSSSPGDEGKAECRRKLDQKVRQIYREGAPANAVGAATVKAWADRWLAMRVRTQRPKSFATDRSAVTKWIVPTIGRKRLGALTPADVRSVGSAIRSAGCTSSTERRAHIVLIKMLKDAILEGHEVSNRLLLMKPPASSVHDRNAIDVDDARSLLRVAAEHPNGSRWLAKLLQGMRQGEILGLTWPMVDFSGQAINVSWQLQALNYQHGCRREGTRWVCGRRFGGDCPARSLRVPDGYDYRQLDGALCLVRPKTAKGQRIVPMVPWMATALQSWRAVAPTSPHGLVWPRSDGRPSTARSDTAAWNALQDEADVHGPGRPYYGHEARHTTATLLLEAGVDPKVVQAILGHNSVATSRLYQHVSQDTARRALDSLVERLHMAS